MPWDGSALKENSVPYIISTACFGISLFWNSMFQQQKVYCISLNYKQQEPVVLWASRAPKENSVPYICSLIYLLIYLSNVQAGYRMYQLNIIQIYEQRTKTDYSKKFIKHTSTVQNIFNFEQFYNRTCMCYREKLQDFFKYSKLSFRKFYSSSFV